MAARVTSGFAIVACAMSLTLHLYAQTRTEITINDTGVQAENLTSAADGTLYFGSTAKGTIYRAAPGASQAEPWILASATGLTNVSGVLADDKTNTLWVCQNNTGGRGNSPVVGQTALRSFDLKTGAAKGTFNSPSNGGFCNDIAVATNGTVYATESFANRIMRLKPGATSLEVWITDDQLAGIDGIAFLPDGAMYVNTFFGGGLFRVAINPDGSPALTKVETSLPLSRPDGLRPVGTKTLLQAEGSGRLTEITINGNRAEVRVISEGLTGATGVTLVGDNALVLIQRAKAVTVPYKTR
jgi:sugar lactone lactonase YvrE